MSIFHIRAKMAALHHTVVINPSKDEWDGLDSPSWQRMGYPDPNLCERQKRVKPVSILLQRQAD